LAKKNLSRLNDRRWVNIVIWTHLRSFNPERFFFAKIDRAGRAEYNLSLNLQPSHLFATVALLLLLYMSIWFVMAIVKKRADLADIAWGLGFMLVAWASIILGQITAYGLIVNMLVTLWALRLVLHIYLRNRNRDEDFRYQALKEKWGGGFQFQTFF